MGFGEYGLVEWTPRCELREAEPEVSSKADVTAAILRALLPFREAREAVVRALREAGPEPVWSG
jgi:hypothetical protein